MRDQRLRSIFFTEDFKTISKSIQIYQLEFRSNWLLLWIFTLEILKWEHKVR